MFMEVFLVPRKVISTAPISGLAKSKVAAAASVTYM